MPITAILVFLLSFVSIMFWWIVLNKKCFKKEKSKTLKKIFNIFMTFILVIFISSVLSFLGVPAFQTYGPLFTQKYDSYSSQKHDQKPPEIINKVERPKFDELKQEHRNSLEDWKKN